MVVAGDVTPICTLMGRGMEVTLFLLNARANFTKRLPPLSRLLRRNFSATLPLVMTVLFSPLGLAYGTLYSAILLVRPRRVVVVTSPQAVGNLFSAVDAARFYHAPFEVQTHLLDDPLAGFAEGRKLARHLVTAAGGDNIINLTGGTTALQDCVRSVAILLRAENKAVREVAVIDRRDADDQRRTPLVVGELVEVAPP